MSTNYRITDSTIPHFLTLTLVEWVDLFTREKYRQIIIDSLKFSIREKGLVLHAYVIMSNHVHLIASVKSDNLDLSNIIRDLKRFTAREIYKQVKEDKSESRREWLLDRFSFEAKRSGRAKYFKVWKDDNHAVDLSNNNIDIFNKIDYIHYNPVSGGWVNNPEEFLYSSAIDYSGGNGLVKVEVI